MNGKTINWNKIGLFILISCLISWLFAAIIYWIKPEQSLIAILMIFYMWGPAVASLVVQKYIYKQTLKVYDLRFDSKKINWFGYTIVLSFSLLLLSILVVILLGNTELISSFGKFHLSSDGIITVMEKQLKSANLPNQEASLESIKSILEKVPPIIFLIGIIFSVLLAGPTINALVAFGEELGWRGLLQKETQSLGFLQSSLLIATIWGLWHAPIILMGHNYPNYPYIGILFMAMFTISLSPLFTYLRFKTESVFSACILHGIINASGGIYILFISSYHELFSSIAGFAGILSGIIITVGIYVFDKKFISDFNSHN